MKAILLFIILNLFTLNCYSQLFSDSTKWMLSISPEGYTGFTELKDFLRAQFGFKFDDSQVQLNHGFGVNLRYFRFIQKEKTDIPYFVKSGITSFINKNKTYIWSVPFSVGMDYYLVGPVALNAEVGSRYFFNNSNFEQFSNNLKLEYGAGLKTAIRLSGALVLGIQISYRKIGKQNLSHGNIDFPIMFD